MSSSSTVWSDDRRVRHDDQGIRLVFVLAKALGAGEFFVDFVFGKIKERDALP